VRKSHASILTIRQGIEKISGRAQIPCRTMAPSRDSTK